MRIATVCADWRKIGIESHEQSLGRGHDIVVLITELQDLIPGDVGLFLLSCRCLVFIDLDKLWLPLHDLICKRLDIWLHLPECRQGYTGGGEVGVGLVHHCYRRRGIYTEILHSSHISHLLEAGNVGTVHAVSTMSRDFFSC